MSSPPSELTDAQLYQKKVGARIQELRALLGRNQDVFAYETGLHRSYVGQLENGHKDLRLSTLFRIAQTYGLQVHELLDSDRPLHPVQVRGQKDQ